MPIDAPGLALLIEAAARSHASYLKVGDFEIRFGLNQGETSQDHGILDKSKIDSSPISDVIPLVSPLAAASTSETEDQEIDPEDEAAAKQQHIDELLFTNPMEYERMFLQGEMENNEDQATI